eukprot:TRINITY_DN1512_c0_g1_i3.p1 TRINITY_DN1512_c0_g1~~TRINITY_DN1512_c0_g1_i3.p1  ORF type:complete len:465 (-),score=133.29 TRINITY_DN1512_c0_g1_i3:72-1466(-)
MCIRDRLLTQKRIKGVTSSPDKESLHYENLSVEERSSLIEEQAKKFVYAQETKDRDGLCRALSTMREVVSATIPPLVEPLISTGIMTKVLPLLNFDLVNETLVQEEASWLVLNVLSSESKYIEDLVDAGVITTLVELLRSPHIKVVGHALWSLANITGDLPAFRDMVLEFPNFMERLIEKFNDFPKLPLEIQRILLWISSNLSRKPFPSFEALFELLPFLAELIPQVEDEEAAVDLFQAIINMTSEDEQVEEVMKLGVASDVVDTLKRDSEKVVAFALRLLANLTSGDDNLTQEILDIGLLEHLERLLSHPGVRVRQNALWTLSNILAGDEAQIEAVISTKLLALVDQQMLHGEEEVQGETLFCFINILINPSPEQLRFLLSQFKIVEKILTFLERGNKRQKAQALLGIERLLEKGVIEGQRNPYAEYVEAIGGRKLLEEVTKDLDPKVAARAGKILDNFYSAD